jgi:hypothetical protein
LVLSLAKDDPGLVDENQTLGINLVLMAFPARAMAGCAGAILRGRKNAFFIPYLRAMNEVPDRSTAHLDAPFGQFGDPPAQGHIGPAGDPPQKRVRRSDRAADGPPSVAAPRRAKAWRPFHAARNAHKQRRGNRANRLARPPRATARSRRSKQGLALHAGLRSQPWFRNKLTWESPA